MCANRLYSHELAPILLTDLRPDHYNQLSFKDGLTGGGRSEHERDDLPCRDGWDYFYHDGVARTGPLVEEVPEMWCAEHAGRQRVQALQDDVSHG